ncbi:MAG: class I SAM-dependent methyltransferase [Acidobacteriota bacterium]
MRADDVQSSRIFEGTGAGRVTPTSDAEEGWDAYSRGWSGAPAEVLGDEWFTPEQCSAIWTAFGEPFARPGSDALEIGPGGGKWSRRIAARCGALAVADVSSEMLTRTAALLGDRVRAVKLDGTGFGPLADASFDFVWAFDVYVHLDLEDAWRYLNETRRVLRPDGRAVVHMADFLSAEGFAQFQREAPQSLGRAKWFSRLRWMTDPIARRLADAAGFRVVAADGASGPKLAPRDLLYVLAPKA